MEILSIYLRRTVFDKVLRNKVFNIAKNLKDDAYERGLDNKSSGANTLCSFVKNEVINQGLAKDLNKLIVRKLEKLNILILIDHICQADLGDMKLMSKYNKGMSFCVVIRNYLLFASSENTHGLFL